MTKINLGTLAAALVACAVSSRAHAHISMTGALAARGGDQKAFPCDGNRGDGPVYTFEPGTEITLSVAEVIPHPSYFRIAFDNDGDDGFVDPQSIDPIEQNRTPDGPCYTSDANNKAADHCGKSDFCNVVSNDGPTVLWDNLNPHEPMFGATWSWNVKLPNIECDNCVIQVIQVMEDASAHGPYCVHGNDCSKDQAPVADIYHRCIDIKLKKGATNSDGVSTAAIDNMGMQCMAADTPPDQTHDDAGAPDTTSDAGTPQGTNDGSGGSTDTGNTGDTGSTGSTGTHDAGSSKDAGKSSTPKGDAATSDEDTPKSGDDGGCSAGGHGASAPWSASALLVLGMFLARRRRSRA